MSRQDWRSISGVTPLDAEDWRRLTREVKTADHCHGIVTRDWEQDACGKPPVAIIDGRGTEAESFWPACAYHANPYGGPACVPISVIVFALRSGGSDA